jgi:hypothetical protein
MKKPNNKIGSWTQIGDVVGRLVADLHEERGGRATEIRARRVPALACLAQERRMGGLSAGSEIEVEVTSGGSPQPTARDLSSDWLGMVH